MINLKLRLSKRQNLNRYDNFKISFYKKIQNGFIKITKKNKKKYLLVNSNDSINENKKIILNKTNKLLGL
jgi:dTMP kinase